MVEKLDRVLEILTELRTRLDKLEKEKTFVGAEVKSLPKKESIIEFYLKYKPKTDTDNTLILLSYLDNEQHVQNISSNDVLQAFVETRLPSPKNIFDKMQLLYKRGLAIRSSSKPFYWQISLKGGKHLEALKNE